MDIIRLLPVTSYEGTDVWGGSELAITVAGGIHTILVVNGSAAAMVGSIDLL